MFFKQDRKKYVYLLVCFITFIFIFPKANLAKISDKNAIKTFWKVLPIIPGAAKYFIRTEKIEKKTKVLNNHPIKISDRDDNDEIGVASNYSKMRFWSTDFIIKEFDKLISM